MKLSILLRNLNEGDYLKQFFQDLRWQVINYPYEVIVVDNESDDHSLEIVLEAGCKVITIPRKSFTYGGALNSGISECSGEYIFIASPHISLRSNDFLQKAIQYIDKEEKAAGLRFILPGKTITNSRNCDKEYNILTYEVSPKFFEKNNTHLIVNHCSLIRKKCWEILQFDADIIACEDKKWSLQILQKGFQILYNIPLLYTYEKQLPKEAQSLKTARELAANEIISGQIHPLYKAPYIKAVYQLIRTELWRLKKQIKNHRQIHKELKKIRKP